MMMMIIIIMTSDFIERESMNIMIGTLSTCLVESILRKSLILISSSSTRLPHTTYLNHITMMMMSGLSEERERERERDVITYIGL